jgi:hypothetical protein
MASLSGSLRGVIESLPHSTPPDLISMYKQNISNNADELDKIEVDAGGAASTDSATRARKASRMLFGDSAVFPERTSYSEEQQENWSVDFLDLHEQVFSPM